MFQVHAANETTRPQGFQVTFENGYMVSVMFGQGNYCSNRFHGNPPSTSNTAELAVFKGDSNEAISLLDLCGVEADNSGGCYGWVKPEFVAEVMAKVAAL